MRVWIDIKNSPEVLFFKPIIRRMADAGVETVVSSRDFAQTVGLLDLHGIAHTCVGRHGGGSLYGKGINLARRSAGLTRFGRGTRATQVVSIGSNDLSVASRFLRLHNTVIQDYEHASLEHRINFRLADKVMFPEVVPLEALTALGLAPRKYRPIRGLKEQVTLADFVPDPEIVRRLRLDAARLIVVMRPPAPLSLYNRGVEHPLFDAALVRLRRSDAQIVLLPRSPEQAAAYAELPDVTISREAIDGPSLIYAADLVIGAGGSMNREAALLRIPTWTVFAGPMGAVDRMLVGQGRMRALEDVDEIVLEKRTPAAIDFEPLADEVTAEILRR